MENCPTQMNKNGSKRKSLQTLQPSSDNKVLVGASGPHFVKNSLSKSIKADDEAGLKMPKEVVPSELKLETSSVESRPIKLSITCEHDELSAEYWSTIAERRRLALVETVSENERLREEILRLKAQLENKTNEIALLTPLADQAQYLAAVLKELTEGIEDDTEEAAGND